MHRYPASMRVKCVNRMRWDAVQHGENYAAIVMHTLRSIFPSDVIILSYPIQNCFTFSILVRAIPDETPCDRSIHALTTNIERTRARLLTTMTRTFLIHAIWIDRIHSSMRHFSALVLLSSTSHCIQHPSIQEFIHPSIHPSSMHIQFHDTIDSSSLSLFVFFDFRDVSVCVFHRISIEHLNAGIFGFYFGYLHIPTQPFVASFSSFDSFCYVRTVYGISIYFIHKIAPILNI